MIQPKIKTCIVTKIDNFGGYAKKKKKSKHNQNKQIKYI
jgi:hypothetical protein